MSAVVVEDVVAGYGDAPVLRGVSLRVAPGELAAVLGPSGCGKSTLLRVVAGFLRPAAGRVVIGDRQVNGDDVRVPPERRRIGIVPQEGALFPHLDVAGNVGFGLPRNRESLRRVDELLELIGLPGMGRTRPHELSGGMQQRVAVARALAPRPEVILLDEPFSALDAGLRTSVRDDVRRVLAEEGTTAVLVTHDQDEALSLADRVVVLRRGVVAQDGTPRQVYREPADLEVARFVGAVVELPARLVAGPDGMVARCALGDVPVTASAGCGDRVGPDALRRVLALRPEQVRPEVVTPGAPLADVTAVRFHGHDVVLQLRLRDSGHELTSRTGADGVPQPGDTVALRVVGVGRVY